MAFEYAFMGTFSVLINVAVNSPLRHSHPKLLKTRAEAVGDQIPKAYSEELDKYNLAEPQDPIQVCMASVVKCRY